ncbi:YcxB family protein [Catenovulum sp. SM1970]|uniref:YcxB family protein n=1 Tax=Marinifaba aquimaris TaxID=2741323 RepID=UPI0015719646|nr:YcxB family protein [Marinifaba aquimaris]NTS78003.1 YcxB family protein [Marinifaba aquimaris]
MKPEFTYTTRYKLDKSHFSETYDESVPANHSFSKYKKSLILAVIGIALLYLTDHSPYFAWFMIGLAAVDALSVRFDKAWWLTRQMISKAANNELTLTINEDGVHSQSIYVNSKISWEDIVKVEQTKQGWLLHLTKGKTYLSNRCLSDEVIEFLTAKANN